jgi:hypothetical protein
MTLRSRIWLAAAALFIFINMAGAVMAAAEGELLHAGVHVGLLLVGVYYAGRIWRREGSVIPVPGSDLTDRLTHLEESVDAVAIEVERIGEGQRFMTNFFTEKGIPRASGEGAAEPIEIEPPDAPRRGPTH